MQQAATWTKPELCHYNYDMAKPWFVYFDYTDITGTVIRKQYRSGINKIKSKENRIKRGNELKRILLYQLEEGWNPIINQTTRATDAPPNITLALEKVLKTKSASLKKKTMRGYANISDMFLSWCKVNGYDKYPPEYITDKIAQAYMDYLLYDKAYCGKSHNGQLSALKSFFSFMAAKGREWIKSNPFTCVAELPENSGRNVAYTEDEAQTLISYFKYRDKRMYYAVNFIFHCYIRKTELCELRVRDIDFTNKTITVNASASKNRIQDSVTIPSAMIDIIEEMDLQGKPGNWYIFGQRQETGVNKCNRPDDLSDKHLVYVKELRAGAIVGGEYQQIDIPADKAYYSWKHTGVIAYWKVVKDVYYMMRQLRHHDMKVTMVYLKSLGLMPNIPFRDANVTIGGQL